MKPASDHLPPKVPAGPPADPPEPIVCEIHARHAAQASALAEIALACGREVALPLHPRRVAISPQPHRHEDLLVLQLPAHLATAQHRVWCLACRLACFLPQARISVLVAAASQFRPSRRARQLRTKVA
jgi:hypothetical protein